MTEQQAHKSRERHPATVYDAVAGRLKSSGFIKPRDGTATAVIMPEEALYRSRHAPTRYEEDDEYFQNRHLNADQRLPDSDLLKAIHAYAADFYARNTEDGGKVDQKSLDETALLALGILLEEAAAKVIGETGHLALLDDV